MIRTLQMGAALLTLAHAGAALAAEAGTATPPAGAPLVDAATGESWSRVTATAPATFTLTGPARFQVGFRLNLPTDPNEVTPAGILMVRHQGKPLAQYRVMPKAGKDSWKDQAAYKPSASVGFLVEVAPGDQPYEFRLNGAGATGGAVYVIDATKSTRPLPPNAPVVAIPAAPLVATAATPAPAPTPTPSIDAVAPPTPRPASSGDERAFALWAAVGGGSQTRTYVTGAASATDVGLGLRWTPISSAQAWLSAGYESTKDLVPQTLAPVTRVEETRVLVDLGGGYRLSTPAASLVIGPSIHYASFDNDVVGYDWVVASAAARVEAPIGPVDAVAAGEAGVPVSDGTPSDWDDGALQHRLAWSAGLRYRHASLPMSPSVALEYHGEDVSRRYSDLVSHGARIVLQAEF